MFDAAVGRIEEDELDWREVASESTGGNVSDEALVNSNAKTRVTVAWDLSFDLAILAIILTHRPILAEILFPSQTSKNTAPFPRQRSGRLCLRALFAMRRSDYWP